MEGIVTIFNNTAQGTSSGIWIAIITSLIGLLGVATGSGISYYIQNKLMTKKMLQDEIVSFAKEFSRISRNLAHFNNTNFEKEIQQFDIQLELIKSCIKSKLYKDLIHFRKILYQVCGRRATSDTKIANNACDDKLIDEIEALERQLQDRRDDLLERIIKSAKKI